MVGGLLGLAVLAAASAPASPAAPLGAAATAAAPATVLAAADAYVLKSSPGANYGTAKKLKVQGPDKAVGYLLFNVSGLASAPASASLQVYATAGGPGFEVRAAGAVSWGEKTITYENQPGYASSAIASSGPVTSGRWYTLDLSSLVTGDGGYSLALVGVGTTANALAARESGSAKAPRLVLASSSSGSAPVNTSPPTVTGTAQVGETLTAQPGAWSGTPAPTYAYQWQRCDAGGAGCADITGAGGQTYAVTATDAGSTLRVAVAATNDAGSATAYSAATAPVAAASLPATVRFGGNAPVGQSHETSVQALETKAGRKLAIVRVYDRWDQAFPTSDDLWLASTNHPIVLSVKARRLDGTYISFADIAAAAPGSPLYDDIVAWAGKVKQFNEHVWFTFNPEPESANSQASGGAADYVAAWQNVVSIFRAQGVSNADYLWDVTAFGLGNGTSDAYYPGDSWVDDIGADGYNSFGCKASGWRSFADVFAGLRSFADAHPGKGVMIPEWGSTEDASQPGRKAAWVSDMEQTLETSAWSRVGAVLVWSSTVAGTSGTCDYRVDTSQSALDAWKAMGADSYFGKLGA